MKRLDGFCAVVTGAGAGLGLAISELFAVEGAHVYLTDIDEAAATASADKIKEAGGSASALRVDATSADDIKNMFDAIRDGHGRLDVLVNNAGINIRSDFRHMSDEDWDTMWQTNMNSAIRCSRDGLPLLQKSDYASIINLSSIMSIRHLRQMSAYSTTKAALSGLSRSMAVEYASFGVRVNYLCPGYIDTALTERFLRNPRMRDFLVEQTPMGALASPEDVAYAALFLASKESRFITGQGITVDGGMSVGL